MKPVMRIALALSATGLSPAAALAADYDPPIYVDEAPEYVPVEVGSGWYLRGDVSYAVNKPFKDSDFGALPVGLNEEFSDRFMPVSASIGMGYHINDYLRAELNVGLMPFSESSLSSRFDPDPADPFDGWDAEASTENRMYSGMVAGYVDLGTYAGFTPYVGAGAGLVYNHYKYSFRQTFNDGATPDVDFTDSDRKYAFAYTLGAGIAYNISRNVALDVGYQYFSSPDAEWVSITGPDTYEKKEGIDYHQVKVGLRYDLW